MPEPVAVSTQLDPSSDGHLPHSVSHESVVASRAAREDARRRQRERIEELKRKEREELSRLEKEATAKAEKEAARLLQTKSCESMVAGLDPEAAMRRAKQRREEARRKEREEMARNDIAAATAAAVSKKTGKPILKRAQTAESGLHIKRDMSKELIQAFAKMKTVNDGGKATLSQQAKVEEFERSVQLAKEEAAAIAKQKGLTGLSLRRRKSEGVTMDDVDVNDPAFAKLLKEAERRRKKGQTLKEQDEFERNTPSPAPGHDFDPAELELERQRRNASPFEKNKFGKPQATAAS